MSHNTYNYQSYQLTKSAYPSNNTRKYSIKDLIMNSPNDLYRYTSNASRFPDNGAFLLITENQFIIGINGDDGLQAHVYSYATSYLELTNSSYQPYDLKKACEYTRFIKDTFITGNIVAELDTTSHYLNQVLRIRMHLPRKNISKNEFITFENLYNSFGEVLQNCKFQYNLFISETHEVIRFEHLIELYNFFESRIDENLIIPKLKDKSGNDMDEIIIGYPSETNKKKYR